MVMHVIRRIPPRDLFDSSDYVSAEAPLFKQVVSDFLKERRLKPNTVKDYEKRLIEVADWMEIPVNKISRKMILDRHQSLHIRGPHQADVVMRVVRSMLAFAQVRYENLHGESFLMHNAVDVLKQLQRWSKPKRRRTLIMPHQLPDWWRAVRSSCSDTVRDYLILMILTGLRRSEAANLRWSDIDMKGRIINIDTTKNGDPHSLPITNYLFELLKKRGENTAAGAFIFPGRRLGKPLVNCNRIFEQMSTVSGVQFCPHDLRRTFASTAAGLGLDGYVIKRLLNHRRGNDVTLGYIIYDIETLREPMQKIEDCMLSIAGVNRRQ